MNQKYLLERAITVRDLIDYLVCFSEDTKVMFRHPSHDHWRTELAAPVESVNQESVFWSAYHESFKLLHEESEDSDDEDSEYGHEVVILG